MKTVPSAASRRKLTRCHAGGQRAAPFCLRSRALRGPGGRGEGALWPGPAPTLGEVTV